MSEEKIREMEEELQEMVGEALKSLNVPVFAISREVIDKLLNEVKQLPGIEKKYSARELHQEVSSFVSKFTVMRPKDKTEAEERIKKFLESLEKEKTYEAFIILPSVIGIPIGTKIGHGS